MAAVDPERWRVLSPYLDEGLELPPDQRLSWLARIGDRDPRLAADLERLLAEQLLASRERFLEQPVLESRSTTSMAGQVIGAYRLLSLIGQGGSGSVWLAERCDGRFQGRAAVKLLNLALLAHAGEERFRREGTILARLRHPGIAHLIDAGVSPAGQPYLVLEHVDGEPIDQYCDRHRLDIAARLRLFLNVLDAAAHAHTNLIIHRDIKPANVLVSDDGHVKLLDFGIAKLVERQNEWANTARSESTAVTRAIGKALTPEYASPEQVSGGGITTATDLYALGLLLYLLLTGRHPAGDAMDSPAALLRWILVTEPALASQVGSDSPGHAVRCGTTPKGLKRMLRGDLDAILVKALRKNPSERYASVTAFADDIRRFVRREPVAARPDSLAYRTRCFTRRHAAPLAVGALALITTAVATTAHTTRLAAERDRAHRETAKAVKASEMLMGLLTTADPYAGGPSGADTTVRSLLDSASARVQKDLAEEPELQADMLTMMGRTYRRLGVFDRAEALLEQALTAAQNAFGFEHVRVAQTLHDLGVLFADRGDYVKSGRTLEMALAMRRRLLGPAHPDIAVTLAELGRVYQDEGSNDRAEPLHREALHMRRRLHGERDGETAVSLSDLASIHRLRGDLQGAEDLLRKSLTINRQVRGERHPNTAASLHDLALIAARRGDLRGAAAQLRQVLEIQREALGSWHPVVAATLNSLSRVEAELGQHDAAASRLQEALEITRRVLRHDHQLTAIYSLNLASIYLAQRKPELAWTLADQGRRIRAMAPSLVPTRRRTFPEDDWTIGAAERLVHSTGIAAAR